MKARSLDRSVQFRRASLVDDGLQQVETWIDHGPPHPAGRRDVSDAERAASGWIEATVASRFVVRSSEFTRGLTAKDRLVEGGREFSIVGIKEIGRREGLEITAIASADR